MIINNPKSDELSAEIKMTTTSAVAEAGIIRLLRRAAGQQKDDGLTGAALMTRAEFAEISHCSVFLDMGTGPEEFVPHFQEVVPGPGYGEVMLAGVRRVEPVYGFQKPELGSAWAGSPNQAIQNETA